MSRLPKPPIAPNVDIRDFDFMPLSLVQLENSETWAIACDTPYAAGACINLWCRAWHQVPAGSLPDEDSILAKWAGVPDWESVREIALRGFTKCSDGRLYHERICDKVLQAWDRKEATAGRREADRTAKRDMRARKAEKKQRPRPPDNSGTSAGHPQDVQRTTTGRPQDVRSMRRRRTETGREEESTSHSNTASDPPREPVATPEQAGLKEPSPDWHAIGERCLEIIGASDRPTPMPYGLVRQWLTDGFDAERDIYPVLEAMAADGKAGNARSLKYFTGAIEQRRDERLAAGDRGGNGAAKPQSDWARASAEAHLRGDRDAHDAIMRAHAAGDIDEASRLGLEYLGEGEPAPEPGGSEVGESGAEAGETDDSLAIPGFLRRETG